MPKINVEINPENRFEKLFLRLKNPISTLNKILVAIGSAVVMLFIMELLAALSFSLFYLFYAATHNGIYNPKYNASIYEGVPWTRDYFKEFKKVNNASYSPYIGYRKIPNFEGAYINLDEDSNRITEFQCSTENARETTSIYMFGGSSMWGTGARDVGTIPSLVAKDLCAKGYAVTVKNFGESGFTSNVEAIQLQLELKEGKKPDIVVFLDGYNDVFSSYQNREAGLPQNVQNRYYEFNLKEKYHLGMFPNLRRISDIIFKAFTKPELGTVPTKDIYSAYLSSIELVRSLEDNYGFKAFFYWQPSLYTKENPSKEETENIEQPEHLKSLYKETTELVRQGNSVRDLSDIFNSANTNVYLDPVHLSEYGNSLVAKEIAEDLATYLGTRNH